MAKLRSITASGTFDRLHKGHEYFLKEAYKRSRHVYIGITTDVFTKSKPLSFNIEPYEKRKKRVLTFLRKSKLEKRTIIFELNDIYGIALTHPSKIEGILTTDKTVGNAKLINKKRKSLGFPELVIIKIHLITDNTGKILSSINNRKARLLNKNLVLPQNIRTLLKKPLGKLFLGKEKDLSVAVWAARQFINRNKPQAVITVGDVVTRSFNETGISPGIAIVDFRIKREEKIKNLAELGFKKKEPDHTVNNPAGTITSDLSKTIEEITKHLGGGPVDSPEVEGHVIRVFGEEDLAVLPAIILSPNNTVIFYGQPSEGIVGILVDEEVKTRTLNLLSRFTRLE